MNNYGHWDVSCVGDFDPTYWYGFIYLIENTSKERLYIGKKLFLSKKTRVIKKKKKHFFVESDWKTYAGSCKELQTDISNGDVCNFYILNLCSGRAEWSFTEEELQFKNDVLFKKNSKGDKLYYNGTIAHRVFNAVDKQKKLTKEKLGLFNPSFNSITKTIIF